MWKARRAAELAVTPRTRIQLHDIEHQLAAQSEELAHLRRAVSDIEAHLPAVLNAISSMSGASRMAKRELEEFRGEANAVQERHAAQIEGLIAATDALRNAQADGMKAVEQGDLDVLGQIRPHIETLDWLMKRVETIRFELLNELRYGRHDTAPEAVEPRILNPEALERSPLKVNIGAGHIPFEGYVNVDMRDLPGIDVIAMVDALPFEPGTVDELFSSHTLEHFPQELLRRQLLPYWATLLKPGGTITTIAPDLEAMSADFANGSTSFEDFREVVYGGQEYEGDTHFTGFTPSSFCDLLTEAGFVDAKVVAANRRNGKCKEFEITARKAG